MTTRTTASIALGLLLCVGVFAAPDLAQAQASTASSVTCNGATLQGDVTVQPAGETVTAWFEWGTSGSFGNTTAQQTFTSTGQMQLFSQPISGLSENTTYSYRAVASSPSNGTAFGGTLTFTTPSCGGGGGTNIPTATTNPATNVTQNFATLNGFASGNGGNANAWFEWGTSQSLGNATPQQFMGSTGSSYSHTLTLLSPNTTYYYRAVAQGGTNNQLVQGNIQSFTTSFSGQVGTQVFVNTNSATGVNDTFAVLNGYVDPAGTTVSRWFEWGTGGGLGNTTIKLQQSGASVFSQAISGLVPNTTYYFRAVAQNQSGQQFFGNILTFTTTGFGQQVSTNLQATTLLATNVGQTSARLNGLAIQNQNFNQNFNYNYNYSGNTCYVNGAYVPCTTATGGYAQVSGYFEWGSTQSLGNITPSQTIGSAPSLAFFHSLFGLTPSATYYYRAVVTDGVNTARGSIVSFTTGTQTVTVTPPPSRTTVIVGGTGKPALVALSIDRNGACNLRLSSAEYVITYKNISGKLLKDVAIRIVLPEELAFLDTSRGSYTDNDRTVVIALGTLAPNEEGTVRVRGEVIRSAVIGKTTVTTVYLVDTDSATGAQEEVVAYSLNPICEGGVGQSAASFFGGAGFLPDSLIEWLILILLIFALVALARYMYGERRAPDTV
ncbi:MAG: hypothetical protein Q8Q36_02465 [bacterium]|nr:hypothetical protein [bacterium]